VLREQLTHDVAAGHRRRGAMSGIRGSTSGSPRHPLLSGRRHLDADTDTLGDRDQQHGNGNGRPDQDDQPQLASVEEHRETVVRRLLARGLSPTTIATLLPDFRPLVERLDEDD
jgi:hypothetical protein